ncbi:hypothetical protein BpHYR1_031298 [Brachionus plicatilis]|uniref:Death domain-containing protein n=1 Tax=Brachionus plicatilis TaxID=10195 RepID=A0A3M7T700_BRAPC|nr:hypothetical protein BpHYR1_031298 [Brachionus plicatilis]
MFNDEKIPLVKPIKAIQNFLPDQNGAGLKRKLLDSPDEADCCHEAKRPAARLVGECQLDDRALWTIANEYEPLDDWKSVAKCLALSNQDILLIEHKHHDLLECFYQMLVRWRLRQPENCNWNFFSKKICQKFGKPIWHGAKKEPLVYFNQIAGQKPIENVRLNEKVMWQVSDFMCEHWKSIGRYLGLRESTLVQIESKYLSVDGLRECCYQMMLTWSQQFSSEAFVKTLSIKLIEMNFNFYAKELLDFF